jgi:hypothetical protein
VFSFLSVFISFAMLVILHCSTYTYVLIMLLECPELLLLLTHYLHEFFVSGFEISVFKIITNIDTNIFVCRTCFCQYFVAIRRTC